VEGSLNCIVRAIGENMVNETLTTGPAGALFDGRGNARRILDLFIGLQNQSDSCQRFDFSSNMSVTNIRAVPILGLSWLHALPLPDSLYEAGQSLEG
jgi:hypothetical protein